MKKSSLDQMARYVFLSALCFGIGFFFTNMSPLPQAVLHPPNTQPLELPPIDDSDVDALHADHPNLEGPKMVSVRDVPMVHLATKLPEKVMPREE